MSTLAQLRAEVMAYVDDTSLSTTYVDARLKDALRALTPFLKLQTQMYATLTAEDLSVALPGDIYLLLAVHKNDTQMSLRDGEYQVIGDTIVFNEPEDGDVVTVTYYKVPETWTESAEPEGVPDMWQDLLKLHASAAILRREECIDQYQVVMGEYQSRLREFSFWAAQHRGYKPPLQWRMA